MGQTSAKFAPKMEGEDGQHSIPTTGTCEAEDVQYCAETNTISASHRLRPSAEEACRADAPALRFDYQRAQQQAQRGVCLGGNERNRMRDKLPGAQLRA
jgi:hypothetical protein